MFPAMKGQKLVSQKKVYYAHSQALYDTPQEERDVALLEAMGFEVLNPNSPHIQEQYEAWVKAPHSSGQKMEIFRSFVVNCDVLAFRAHPSGGIPAGVAKEIGYALERTSSAEEHRNLLYPPVDPMPIFELPRMLGERTLSVEATRAWLMEVGQR
jgi:hypothetical protein